MQNYVEGKSCRVTVIATPISTSGSAGYEGEGGYGIADTRLGTLFHGINHWLTSLSTLPVQSQSNLLDESIGEEEDAAICGNLIAELNLLYPDFDKEHGGLGDFLRYREQEALEEGLRELEARYPGRRWISEVRYQTTNAMTEFAQQTQNGNGGFSEVLSSFGPQIKPTETDKLVMDFVRGTNPDAHIAYGGGPCNDAAFDEMLKKLQGFKIGTKKGDVIEFSREDVTVLARFAKTKMFRKFAQESDFINHVIRPLAAITGYAYFDLMEEDPNELPQKIPFELLEIIAIATARHDRQGFYAETEESWDAINDFMTFVVDKKNRRRNLHDMTSRVDDPTIRKLSRFVAMKWTGEISQTYVEMKSCHRTHLLSGGDYKKVELNKSKRQVPGRFKGYISHALVAQFIWEINLLQECINRGITEHIPQSIQAQVKKLIEDPTSWSELLPYFSDDHSIVLLRMHFPIIDSLKGNGDVIDPDLVRNARQTMVLTELKGEDLAPSMRRIGRSMMYKYLPFHRRIVSLGDTDSYNQSSISIDKMDQTPAHYFYPDARPTDVSYDPDLDLIMDQRLPSRDSDYADGFEDPDFIEYHAI